LAKQTEIGNLTEFELVKACLKENALAQHELYLRFADSMYTLCLRYARNKEEAKDLLQEGFIVVYKKLHQFNFEGAIGGWIRRVIVTTAINYLKKYKVFDEIKEEGAAMNSGYVIDGEIENKELMQALMQLPIDYRVPLCLFAIEEYSHKEIAALLNIAESSSRTKIFRARNLLKDKLIALEQITLK
jgi:RNA polymerase sigma factor (sigma-70 family)